MIILDTNVLSELTRSAPAAEVLAWARAQDADAIFTTTISEAEMRYGLASMPDGRRRAALARAIDTMLSMVLGSRVLPFDRIAATEYGDWAATRRRLGRPVAMADLLIAAIARARGATAIATRNTDDFAGCGIPLINPWQPTA